MRRSHLALAALSLALAAGCTIIIHDKPNGNGKPAPKHVQMLVVVNVDRSAVNFAQAYETLVRDFQTALALQDQPVFVSRLALLPLNRRTTAGARLVYGETLPDSVYTGIQPPGQQPDPTTTPDGGSKDSEENLGSPFGGAVPEVQGQGSLGLTIAAAAGSSILSEIDPSAPEQSALAEVGASIGTQVVYSPTRSDPAARPLFAVPEDGFIVLTLNHLERNCGAGDAACKLGGLLPVDYFTAKTGESATWLKFAGQAQLPPSRIFHVSMATAEGQSSDAFYQSCSSVPGFPANFVDLMEPSSAAYYGPLMQGISGKHSGRGIQEDLCQMLGATRSLRLVFDAKRIADALAEEE